MSYRVKPHEIITRPIKRQGLLMYYASYRGVVVSEAWSEGGAANQALSKLNSKKISGYSSRRTGRGAA